MEIIQGETAAQNLKAPDDLWHALIFYTSGEIVRRELGKQNDPSYRPYAYRAGVYERSDLAKLRSALEQDWQPYLDGQTRFAEALHSLVRDTAR